MARDLYDVAREVCHKHGIDWTDPRTGITHPAPPSITCPKCGKTSYNMNDIDQRYCGACHAFHEGEK